MIRRPWPHALAACLLVMAAPATARDLTPAEQAGLQDRIDSFEQAFEQGDMDEIFSVIPPGILANATERYGMSEEEVLTTLKDTLAKAMEAATVEDYEIDLASATTGETSAGRVYVLIPTTTVIAFDDETSATSDTQTLAFAEDGRWYLVRIDEAQQITSLKGAYPEFESVTFTEGRATQGDE